MRWSAVVSLLPFLAVHAAGATDVYRLAAGDWPPYIGTDLPDGGSAGAILFRAFAAVGARVEFDHLPFARATRRGLDDPTLIGYLVEYRSPETEARCALSDPIGRSPVGLVERSDMRFTWKTVDDLRGVTIAVVDGYVNDGGPFDAGIASGSLSVVRVRDDLSVLRLVAGDRVPLGVVDVNVLHHLVEKYTELDRRLWMVPLLLGYQDLLVCFRPDATGRAARDRLNAGLSRIDMGDATARERLVVTNVGWSPLRSTSSRRRTVN